MGYGASWFGWLPGHPETGAGSRLVPYRSARRAATTPGWTGAAGRSTERLTGEPFPNTARPASRVGQTAAGAAYGLP